MDPVTYLNSLFLSSSIRVLWTCKKGRDETYPDEPLINCAFSPPPPNPFGWSSSESSSSSSSSSSLSELWARFFPLPFPLECPFPFPFNFSSLTRLTRELSSSSDSSDSCCCLEDCRRVREEGESLIMGSGELDGEADMLCSEWSRRGKDVERERERDC